MCHHYQKRSYLNGAVIVREKSHVEEIADIVRESSVTVLRWLRNVNKG